MKTICCLLATAALLCGCKPKPDPRIAVLTSNISELEYRLDKLELALGKNATNASEAYGIATNAFDLALDGSKQTLKIQVDQLSQQLDIIELQRSVSNICVGLNVKGSSQYVYRARPQPGVIPAEVAAQIRARALEKWPADFEMQAYEIKKQMEAWYQVNR